MGSLFKILLVTAPVLALIFYYVVAKQSALDVDIKKESLQFERDWNEWQMPMFGKDKEDSKKYAERAEAEKELILEIEKKEKEKQEKVEKFEKEFDKALDDFEKKQQK